MAFGSPVVPKTPEACALHYIDNLDAKMEMKFHGYTTAQIVAPNIYDKVRPLPGYLIEPLKAFPPDEDGLPLRRRGQRRCGVSAAAGGRQWVGGCLFVSSRRPKSGFGGKGNYRVFVTVDVRRADKLRKRVVNNGTHTANHVVADHVNIQRARDSSLVHAAFQIEQMASNILTVRGDATLLNLFQKKITQPKESATSRFPLLQIPAVPTLTDATDERQFIGKF